MKKIIFLTFMMMTFGLHAADEIAMCEKEAMKFGDGNGRDSIPEECSKVFFEKGNEKLKKKSSDGKVSVHALKNIIFVKDPGSKMKGQNIIAGKYTELNDIVSIALDEKNKEIVVLDKSGDIFFFSSVITGNVAPLRIIKHDDLEGAVEIKLLPEKDQIAILNSEGNVYLHFSRLANIHAPEGKKKLEPIKKSISGN